MVVSNYDLLYEMLVQRGIDFANRLDTFRLDYVSFKGRGLVTQHIDQKFYKVDKSVMHKSLKQYSSGMDKIQDVVIAMLKNYKVKLEKTKGKPYNPTIAMNYFVIQTLMSFLLGRFIEDDDETFKMVKEMTKSNSQSLVMIGSELDVFPLLKYYRTKAYQRLARGNELSNILWAKYRGEITEAAESQNEVHSMMNALPAARQAQETEVIKDINVQLIFTNSLVAGSATTFNTLSSFMNTLTYYTEVQRKSHEEVDEVVGSERDVTLADRQNMPYTRATLFEVNRFAVFVPLGITHATSRDCQLAGVDLPKGTCILTNLWALHHDKEFWGDPWEFRPERFLDDQGQLVPADHENRKHLMPFGAGFRVCIGEVFAMSRMFLFIASIMQHFSINPAPKRTSCDPSLFTPGLALSTPEFEVCFELRA